MTDPIADMIIRIKNAVLSRHKAVVMPHSKMRNAIADILVEGQYIEAVEVLEKKPQSDLSITLKYIGKTPAITDVKRVSKPGRRLYAKADKLPATLNGYGLTIVSTSKGLMTGKQARQQKLGGEVVCQIW
ncbi:MAG: 30S ribosomal protein S8 [Patescibacteria group bacterium]